MQRIVLILFIFIVGQSFAQEELDSLISTWNKLAREYLEVSETDSVCKYGNCAVDMLNNQIGSHEGPIRSSDLKKLKLQKAEALSYLVTAYGTSGQLGRARQCYGDAMEIYKEFEDGEETYKLFMRMGRVYDLTTQYVIANQYYNKACQQAIINNDLKAQALCYYFIGLNNRYLGNFSEALKYHLQDLKIQEALGNKDGIGTAYITIAAILNRLNDRSAAIEKLNSAKALFEEIGDTAGIATVYNDLGNTFMYMGDTLTALKNHEKAAELRYAINEYDGIGASDGYIAEIYLEKGNYEKALYYLRLAEHAFLNKGNQDGVMHTFIKIAQLYERKNNLDSALTYITLAENTANDIMNSLGLVKIFTYRGEIWLKEKQYDKALNDFKKALSIATKQNNYFQIYKINQFLANTYSKIDNYLLAFEHQQISMQFKDSVDAKANLKAAVQMDMEYNYQKEKLEDKLLQEKKDELQEALLKNQRTQKKLYFAGVVMFLIVSAGLWNRLRFIRRAGRELLERKEEADRQRMIAETEKTRATRSEKVKEQFLANMSHEIRTPMNAIKGITDILIRNNHLPEQEKYLDAIRQSSESLLVILNEILDLSKLESGKIEPESIPFEPANVFKNIRNMLRFKAEEKGLKLILKTDPNIPKFICGDPTHLGQIILNLASNAVKFTEKGSVTIKADLKHKTEDQVLIRFIISDTGIGIAEDKIEQVFEIFTQGDTDTTRKYGGTGLGLTICKRLVELHKGQIRVESEINKGSTFYVEIPFNLADNVDSEVVNTSDIKLNDLTILLAEDNEFNVMVARDVLETQMPGIKIDVAANGEIAVEKVQNNEYDLILMDIQMPDMDGYEATKSIRKMGGRKSEIPIIAMTANVLKAEVDRCFDAGMDGYISKPFEPEELLHQIKMMMTPV
ncbi:MAG: response regulator [Bacteroidales bacterium]|nr:response regulator [Bacteroidales bacterium]